MKGDFLSAQRDINASYIEESRDTFSKERLVDLTVDDGHDKSRYVKRERLILYSLMLTALLAQTVGASLYKMQSMTYGKDLQQWKHPYWQTALTTIGELMAFLVYFIRETFFKSTH